MKVQEINQVALTQRITTYQSFRNISAKPV